MCIRDRTTCYDGFGGVIPCGGTGQDGVWQKGVAWPSPRFTDNGNGTVTDNLTGLIWLKNANCYGQLPWTIALNVANALASGSCGLTDASSAGAWRLPNVREMQSLVDYGHYDPILPSGHPFTGVQTNDASWTSTTSAYFASGAWAVDMYSGLVGGNLKSDADYVWPVRGGQ